MAVSLWATGRGLGAWVSARRRLERKLWDHRRLARRWVGPLESCRGDLEEPGVLEPWLCPNGVRYGRVLAFLPRPASQDAGGLGQL